jgi:SMC interacting uncharacterized protein involved in chromosome segregation
MPESNLISEIRSSIDARLRALQAKTEALGAQLKLTEQKAAERVEHQKQALRDSLDGLKSWIERQRDMAEAQKQTLATAIDELKVQIALGKAEASDSLDVQRRRFRDGVTRFENECGTMLHKLDAAGQGMMRKYVETSDALDAEFEAAISRAKEEVAHRGAAFDERKREIHTKVDQLKQQIVEKRKELTEKWERFQADLKPGLEQIAKAVKGLFS